MSEIIGPYIAPVSQYISQTETSTNHILPTTLQYFLESALIKLKQSYRPGFRQFFKHKGPEVWGHLFSIPEKCSRLEQRAFRPLTHIFKYLPTDSPNSTSLNLSSLSFVQTAFLSDSPISVTATCAPNPIFPVNKFYRFYLYNALHTHLSFPVSPP